MKAVRIKDEKDKRTRQKKHSDSLSYNSSGKLKNFSRAYNIKTINSGKRASNSRNSLTQRSGKSSPHVSGEYGFNTTRDYMHHEYGGDHFGSINQRQSDRQNDTNPDHFQSK